MNKPLVIMFVGVPGSGKTTFAKRLARTIDAVVLNSDAIRLEMWGTLENVWQTHADPEIRQYNNGLTFGAMDYAAKQILKTGSSVIIDSNANKPLERQKLRTIANEHGAVAIVVRIRVPDELAIERVTTRQASDDSHQKNPEKPREIVERFSAEIEEPGPDESTIEISGELPFEEQYSVFRRELESRLAAA